MIELILNDETLLKIYIARHIIMSNFRIKVTLILGQLTIVLFN